MGCVTSCPMGAVEDAENATCSYPQEKEDCPGETLFVQSPFDGYMRAKCLNECPENTLKLDGECAYSCPANKTA